MTLSYAKLGVILVVLALAPNVTEGVHQAWEDKSFAPASCLISKVPVV